MRQKIDLGEHHQVGLVEHHRVLERLVLALGDRERHYVDRLTQAETPGRAATLGMGFPARRDGAMDVPFAVLRAEAAKTNETVWRIAPPRRATPKSWAVTDTPSTRRR